MSFLRKKEITGILLLVSILVDVMIIEFFLKAKGYKPPGLYVDAEDQAKLYEDDPILGWKPKRGHFTYLDNLPMTLLDGGRRARRS